ncbi:MAG: DUF1573 domain-containing protein [Chitinophagaceae bacterium]|jgi:hypothetical protein|nr:DUF1573 domain-containing protein [Chitinophagaceae bacterium]OQY94766.1 MAG: hypothetical protein B6D37_07885 [Sphingobacteriales bacterium UTBCD1]
MKSFLTLILILSVSLYSVAQNNTSVKGNNDTPKQTVLQLKETEHDFSKIPQGKPVYYNFEIVNTGKEPLKLDDVRASCGCTTPEWNHDPIAPGATAKIKVGYNAAAEGYFEKFITITYNTDQTEQLKIKGTVWKAPQGSAPANASVEFLKKQNL